MSAIHCCVFLNIFLRIGVCLSRNFPLLKISWSALFQDSKFIHRAAAEGSSISSSFMCSYSDTTELLKKKFENPDVRNSFTKSVVSWSDGSLEVMLWNAHTFDFTSFFFGFLLTFFAAHFHFELSFLQTNNFQNECVTKTLSLDPARRLEVQVELHTIFQTLLQCLRIVAGRDSSKHYLRQKKK